MKKSQFNIVTNLDDGTPIVYNSLSRKYIFQTDNFCENIGIDKLSLCKDYGILVDDNIDELNNVVSSVQEETINGSQSLTILPTTNCNARCWYCYERGIEHFDMSQDIIDNTIQFIKDQFQIEQDLSINWFGGEPLMHYDAINQITMAAKAEGFTLNTCITTNGSLITPELISLLNENYKDKFMSITIDAIGENYGAVKRFVDYPSEQAYDRLINNIKSVLSAGIRVLLRINFKDYEEAKKIYSHLESVFSDFPRSLYYIYYAPIWNKNRGHSLEETLEYIDYMRRGYDINILANPYIDNVFIHHIANERRIAYCTAMNKHHYVVNAEGSLYRCHCLVSENKYACGNVKDGVNYSTLGYQMFEPNIKAEQCKSCSIFPICIVKCKARDIIYGDDVICDNTKTIIDSVIKLKIEQKEKRRCRKP